MLPLPGMCLIYQFGYIDTSRDYSMYLDNMSRDNWRLHTVQRDPDNPHIYHLTWEKQVTKLNR